MTADKISKKEYDARAEELIDLIVTNIDDFKYLMAYVKDNKPELDYLMDWAKARRKESIKGDNKKKFDELQTTQPCTLRAWDEAKGEKFCKADLPRCATCAIYFKVMGRELPKIKEE